MISVTFDQMKAHTIAFLSVSSPPAIFLLSGEKEIDQISPFSSRNVYSTANVEEFHMRTPSAVEAVASLFPSADQSTERILSVCSPKTLS